MAQRREATGRVVPAAGTIPWRLVDGELEVLVVHRPRYNDWSWPKGKLEAGEELVVCAVRETIEETGLRVVAGVRLPTVRYPLADGRTKRVSFWAARLATAQDAVAQLALGKITPAGLAEIDKKAWIPARSAELWLSHEKDRAPLEALQRAYAAGMLDTQAQIVVRHTKARSRSQWSKGEASRPLEVIGKARARGLAPVLAAFGVTTLVSSPWRRCVATLAPYARRAGLQLRTAAILTEEAYRANPAEAERVVAKVLGGRQSAALCLHRPVIPAALAVISARARPRVIKALPTGDPYLRTGEMLVLHTVGQNDHTKVVALEYHRPGPAS